MTGVFGQKTFSCIGCGTTCGILNSLSGSLSDWKTGSTTYVNNANCEWMIAPAGAAAITLTLGNFNTQKDKDIVTVSQCTSTECEDEEQLAVLSGSYSWTQTVIGATGFMKVVFTSDSSVIDTGFTASWTAVRLMICLFEFIQQRISAGCYLCMLLLTTLKDA
jgi:hypothetical protein